MDIGRFYYYVVRRGRKPGIYTSWKKCNQQVYGFKESQYKGFMVRREVKSWWSLPRQDPNGDNTVPEAQELAVRFEDLKVGECVSITGDGSNGSGTAATDLLLHELDIAPKLDPTSFMIMEDMVQLLLRVCVHLQVGPPVFFLRDGFRREENNYHGFGVSLQSTAKGINFFVSRRLSTDERLARQDAAFITLERLLDEAEVKIFDFNFQVAL
ncbi:Ribonuclease H [Arachis hypogaea]|nr:Ribonuclease H [Arachis hypogaea]